MIKDLADFRAWADSPYAELGGAPDSETIARTDPLCTTAELCEFGAPSIIAQTEPELTDRALEKVQELTQPQTDAVARALPGGLWQAIDLEFAAPPHLLPHLFEEPVACYYTQMIAAIQSRGGFARIHSHGYLRNVLPHIAATGCVGLDPSEPPPESDVSLAWVRERHGDQRCSGETSRLQILKAFRPRSSVSG